MKKKIKRDKSNLTVKERISNFINSNDKKLYMLFITLVIIGGVSLGCLYINNSARNIVFMDFWRIIDRVIPLAENNHIISILDDLWFWDFGQCNYLIYLLTAINVKYFGLNCLWEEYAGIVVMGIQALVLILFITKNIFNDKNKLFRPKKILFSLLVIFLVFNLNQWEILSLQFSFAFMLRVLLYELIFITFDKAIRTGKGYLKCGIISLVSILLLSQLYFPAMLLSCLMAILIFYLFDRNKNKEDKEKNNKTWKSSLKFWIPSLIAVVLYFSGGIGEASASQSGFIETILSFIKNGTLIQGFFVMLFSSILHQDILSHISLNYIVICGIVLFVFILYALFIYFKNKYYKKTYLPILFIMYGVINIFAVIYARGAYGVLYLTSSRYNVETNFIWLGITFILGLLIFDTTKRKIYSKIIYIICMIGISITLMMSYNKEYEISPFRGVYKENLINLIKENNIKEISLEDLSLFQSPPELVIDGVKQLKEYKLNIFK